ncbi:MAG: hypothetical protein HFJ66_09650 [Eggerthellaceae bacterium]|nr:hypothetical protein [Eggerthellaceae bacterium]
MIIAAQNTAFSLIRYLRGELPSVGPERFEGVIETRIDRIPSEPLLLGRPLQSDLAFSRQVLGEECEIHIQALRENRLRGAGIACHEIARGRMPDTFLLLGHGTLCPAPEELIFQLCQSEDFVSFLKKSYELCGCYSVPAATNQEQRLRQALPLTTPEAVQGHLVQLGPVKGKVAAQKALCYVLPNSASPMETYLVILLILPPRLGGYGFPPPKLNWKITPPRTAANRHPQPFYLDVFWPEFNLALEYDSDDHHFADRESAYRDADRRAILKQMGIEVISVTRGQIQSIPKMDNVARAIAAHMGRKIRLNREGYQDKRLQLHAQLFPRLYCGEITPLSCYESDAL